MCKLSEGPCPAPPMDAELLETAVIHGTCSQPAFGTKDSHRLASSWSQSNLATFRVPTTQAGAEGLHVKHAAVQAQRGLSLSLLLVLVLSGVSCSNLPLPGKKSPMGCKPVEFLWPSLMWEHPESSSGLFPILCSMYIKTSSIPVTYCPAVWLTQHDDMGIMAH